MKSGDEGIEDRNPIMQVMKSFRSISRLVHYITVRVCSSLRSGQVGCSSLNVKSYFGGVEEWGEDLREKGNIVDFVIFYIVKDIRHKYCKGNKIIFTDFK